jgi:lipid A ethanolaminephosphotransferase
MPTTPFLQGQSNRLVNFGIATSGSNCSFQTRWLFRRGVRPWQLPDQPSLSRNSSDGILTGPRTTLWQFAKAAGYQTTYLDTFAPTYGELHTGLTRDELSAVDVHNIIGGAGYQRDIDAARQIVSLLRKSGPTFIYLDKFGSHFPYDEATPPNFNRFARGDGARFSYYRKTLEDLIGSYKNAIAWSVDGFFRELLPQIDFTDTLLIYTSDHGQNLWDDGPTLMRHCDTNPPPTELWVPLIVFTGNESFRNALAASAARSPNQATHFDIFPTLLVAMGYDRAAVDATYGSNLFSIPSGRSRRFLLGDPNRPGYRAWLDVNETGLRLRDRLAAGCISCLWR